MKIGEASKSLKTLGGRQAKYKKNVLQAGNARKETFSSTYFDIKTMKPNC